MSADGEQYRSLMEKLLAARAAGTLTEVDELDVLDELADLWWGLEEHEREAEQARLAGVSRR